MASHGYFHHISPHRPLIKGVVEHYPSGRRVNVEFMIDTGADYTLIVPLDEQRLNIPSNFYQESPGPKHTFLGPVWMDAVHDCFLIFNDVAGNAHTIQSTSLYFARPSRRRFWRFAKRKQPMIGEGKFPSVLGRDIIHKLSLGYCKVSDFLFLTERRDDYKTALVQFFPKPDEEDDIITWLD